MKGKNHKIVKEYNEKNETLTLDKAGVRALLGAVLEDCYDEIRHQRPEYVRTPKQLACLQANRIFKLLKEKE